MRVARTSLSRRMKDIRHGPLVCSCAGKGHLERVLFIFARLQACVCILPPHAQGDGLFVGCRRQCRFVDSGNRIARKLSPGIESVLHAVTVVVER